MKRILVCAMMVATFLTMLNACGQNSEDKWQEQYDLGVRYLSEGNYEEAIIAFTAAIEVDAQRPEGYHSLADVYVARGDIGAAITTLNQGFEETGDSSIIDRLVELENEQSPILTEEGKRNLAWAYNLLEANDYTALCQQGNQLYIDRQYTFPFDDYIGLCFDGAGLHRSFDGIGMKIIDSRHWYFGQLVSGEPEGIGVSYCYRPQVESNGTLFYELYEGEWRNGKANGDGVFTNMIGNTAGEQCSYTYEGVWVDNAINGDVVEINYVGDMVESEYHYACDSGFYVLDERWVQMNDGSYVLPPEDPLSKVVKTYQTEFPITVFGG